MKDISLPRFKAEIPNPTILERPEIEKILPHRGKALIIESAVCLENHSENRLVASFSVDDWYCQGHFPDGPIFPGHWLLEACNQAVGLACSRRKDLTSGLVRWRGIDSFKMRQEIKPGDTVDCEPEIKQIRQGKNGTVIIADVTVFVSNEKVAEAQGITIFIRDTN